jgi:formate hydrogenlyase subunit 4
LPASFSRSKRFSAVKRDRPLLINYYTLIKLFKKGSVYSTSTTFIFKMGPVVSLGAAATVLLFLPIAGHAPVFLSTGM